MPTKKFNHFDYMNLIGEHLFLLTSRWMDCRDNYYYDDGDSIFHKGIITATILNTHPNYLLIRQHQQDVCEYIKRRCLNLTHPNYLFFNGFIEGARVHLGIILDRDIPTLHEVVYNEG